MVTVMGCSATWKERKVRPAKGSQIQMLMLMVQPAKMRMMPWCRWMIVEGARMAGQLVLWIELEFVAKDLDAEVSH